ncbi:MAG: hypothetical protein P1V97_18720 [Planctomycetota bacterium]|nr:hypothetical protein [Planctomycetota bacterium]
MTKFKKSQKRNPKYKAKKTTSSPKAQGPSETIGSGPVGALTRWARLNRRLSFVLAVPQQSPSDIEFKKLARRAQLHSRKSSIGLTKANIVGYVEEQKTRLTKNPFTFAELPTYGLLDVQRAIGGRLAPGLVSGTLAALIHGVPMCLSDHSLVEEAKHLACARFTFRNPGEKQAERLQEMIRASMPKLIDSYTLAEKPLLTLLDMAKQNARPTTLQNKLRRMLETRRRWFEKNVTRNMKMLKPAEEKDKVAMLALDILPLIVARINTDNALELAQALTTPLGSMALGMLPCFPLPEDMQ